MDIRDEAIKRIFHEFKPEIVSHHAAQHSVAIGARDPQYDANVNVVGMLNVLDAAVACGARKVCFASSAATYGDVTAMPVDESSPQRPVSPYGISKMVTEHYLRFYKSEHGLDFTALRYGNVYGPRQDPNGEAGVIAIFAAKFLTGEGVRIDWDGEQTRDYVFVDDVVEAALRLLQGPLGQYNVGTCRETAEVEVVAELSRAVSELRPGGDPPPNPRHGPAKDGEQRRSCLDCSLAASRLDWRAQVALPEGLRSTVAYFADRGPGYL